MKLNSSWEFCEKMFVLASTELLPDAMTTIQSFSMAILYATLDSWAMMASTTIAASMRILPTEPDSISAE